MKHLKYIIGVITLVALNFHGTALSQTWNSVFSHDTLVKVTLIPSKDSIRISDTLEVKVEILNAGSFPVHILSRLWFEEPSNVISHLTDKNGKKIKLGGGEEGLPAMLSAPSTLFLFAGEFWGSTLFFGANNFPKPGVYFLELTYQGCSKEFIKALIKRQMLKRSDLSAPADKFWHGEVRSNKIKVVVKK